MIALGFPQIYRQEANLIKNIGKYVKPFGDKIMLVSDQIVFPVYGEELLDSLKSEGLYVEYVQFNGQTSPEELKRLSIICKKTDFNVVVGFGGGKVQDAAKAMKKEKDIAVVIIPSIASNDAATSRLAITYTEEGRFLGPIILDTNPEAVFVDTKIIVDAPLRFFIAGIGDAFATYYEALECQKSKVPNFFDAQPTQAAFAIAEKCRDIIWEEAENAVKAVTFGTITNSVEKVVEANVLLSGLGFEGCGVAAAHAISQGFTLISAMDNNLHGEEVAVALLSQFVIETRNDVFITSVMNFYQRVGIPFSMHALGYTSQTEEGLMEIAVFACRERSRIYNMSVEVTPEIVFDALKRVELLAQAI